MDIEIWRTVDELLRVSDFVGAEDYLENLLANEEGPLFKGLIGTTFTNAPESVLATINQFISACSKSFDIKAVYLEMNGFDINYDRWYFDLFGYADTIGNRDEQDWLSEYQFYDWPEITLTGFEALQNDFKQYHTEQLYDDQSVNKSYELAQLLVMVKFVSLINGSLKTGELVKHVPVLATAHDFDILARFART